ncbi:TPA: hypothetical protein ACNEB6_004585 [Escherichia coli]
MQDGVRIARDNPDSGVVVRIAGEGRPAPARRAGTESPLIMNVVTNSRHRCQSSGWKFSVHARKRP